MYRKGLLELLRQRPMSLRDIAELMQMPIRDVASDVEHLRKSLKRSDFRLVIEPATCQKCRFTFHKNKTTKPGKCPRCHATWIKEPVLRVTHRHGKST